MKLDATIPHGLSVHAAAADGDVNVEAAAHLFSGQHG
jgi:hypothetical protein